MNKSTLFVLLVLYGCAGQSSPPDPVADTPLLPVAAEPTVPPAPTAVTADVRLPGRILFIQRGELWLWTSDRGRRVGNLGRLATPAWSPDSNQIAVARLGESFSDLVVLDATSGQPLETLTANGSTEPATSYERIFAVTWAFAPIWSPDGDEITFVGQAGGADGSPARDQALGLFALPVTGGERTQLLIDDGNIGRVSYAPGGTLVFDFTPMGENQVPELRRYTPTTGAVEPIVGAPPASYDPIVTPDGRAIVFATRTQDGTDLYTLPLAGGTPQRLTALRQARAPAIAPDGTQLAFLAAAAGASNFDLWIADLRAAADGSLAIGEPRQVTRGLRIDPGSRLAWGP